MSLDKARDLISFVHRAHAAQKAVDEITGTLRHIDVRMTQDEYDAMTFMCGYATAAAKRKGDHRLVEMFRLVANRLHEGDATWKELK
jgi:hypothetical protein